jgi:hypothetical protein
MKKLLQFRFPAWTIPLALAFPLVVAFGILIPRLGFYWDDWETIMVIRMFDLSRFWSYFNGTRPLAAWTYIIFSPILGTNPTLWHSFSLLLRWLTALTMWWALAALWPRKRWQITMAVILFSVYPLFRQQSIAVAYHQHWIGYAAFFFSIGAMIRSIRRPERYWLWMPLSLVGFVFHVTIFEYFVGLELLRPLILWLLLEPGERQLIRKRLICVVRHWIPYLLALSVFIVWRVWLSVSSPDLVDSPMLLFDLAAAPLSTLQHLTQMVLQDVVYILVTNWYDALEPALIDLSQRSSLLIWLISLLTAIGASVYLMRLQPLDDQDTSSSDLNWVRQALLISITALLLGAVPIWMTGRQVIAGLYNDRFAMASMFGASLLIITLLEWLIRQPWQRVIILAVLIGLSTGMHLRIGNTYAWSWVMQKRILWQLYWRAPYIQPNTAILSEGEIFPYVRPTYSINLLYMEPREKDQLSYGFFIIGRDVTLDIMLDPEGRQINTEYRGFSQPFTSHSQESLVIHYNPPDTGCLWVMKPDDQRTPYFLPENVRGTLHLSDLSRIQPDPITDGYPPTDIFGQEPAHGWCYFFEKADLSRQSRNWDAIVSLGDEAAEKGYTPKNIDSPHEWLPFIEGYAYSGEWETAVDLTLASLERDVRYRPTLCLLWEDINTLGEQGAANEKAYEQVITTMQCSP